MTAPTTTVRSYSEHTPQWQRFQTQLMAPSHQVAAIASQQKQVVHPYQRQFSHVYHQRYQQLAPLCWRAVERQGILCKDGNNDANDAVQRVSRILELSEGVASVVVGTLVKEAAADADDDAPLVGDCRASDELFLEDDSGRVALEYRDGDGRHAWPTGAVVAVCGAVGVDGVLRVERTVTPAADVLETPQHDVAVTGDDDDPCYLLLVSGLGCGDPTVPPTARELLTGFCQGRLHHPAAPRVAHVLVAGGWTAGSAEAAAKPALQDADGWLDGLLAAGIPCDVIPAFTDPTTVNWPQRPLHRSLLPRSSRWATCHRTPNPYQASFRTSQSEDAVVVVATDGYNVRAQQGVTAVKDEIDASWRSPTALEVMRQHLAGRHLCPTGPAVVPTAPHAGRDPMVLDDDVLPRLYVTGGHDAFATRRLSDGSRLVAVPSFGHTGTAVLVDLRTLRVRLLKFVDETE